MWPNPRETVDFFVQWTWFKLNLNFELLLILTTYIFCVVKCLWVGEDPLSLLVTNLGYPYPASPLTLFLNGP